jgi:hypothetical protein
MMHRILLAIFGSIAAVLITLSVAYAVGLSRKQASQMPILVFPTPTLAAQPTVPQPISKTSTPQSYNWYVVAQGEGSDIAVTESSFDQASDIGSLKSIWNKMYPGAVQPPLPEVNFDTHEVVLFFMGQQSSGGYSFEMISAKDAVNGVNVTVKKISPGPECMVTQAITSPFLMVAIEKQSGPQSNTIYSNTIIEETAICN